MSVLGLALGVATLIVVLSVMNGFERELRNRILSVTSHATLSGLQGPMEDLAFGSARGIAPAWRQAAVPYVEEQSMLANGNNIAGCNRARRPAQ